MAAADFDYNYTPVTEQYPALVPGNYVVSAGDTLRGIALAVYGDAQLWYLIADANGLQTDAELTAGRSLTIPNKITNLRNAYDTYKPYEPGRIVGDLTPTLPEPPPPPAKKGGGGGCGGIGRILVTIVMIVVAIYTAGAALGAIAPGATVGGSAVGASAWATGVGISSGGILGATTGQLVLAGAIGGAVGSIASQAVGIALGVQDKFSWSNVALSAIGGGVSAGLAAPGSPLAGSGPGMTIARAVVGNVISQGVSVAVGLQDKFDWKGVAAAGIGAGVSVGLGQILPQAGPGNTFGSLMRDTAIRFASGVARQAVYGGKIDFANVAADAFGNALGNSIAYSAMASSNGAQQVEQLSQAQGAANGWSAEQQALLDHAIAQGGMSEEDYWNNPATQAGRYAEHFGGDVVLTGGNADDRLRISPPPSGPDDDALAKRIIEEWAERDLAENPGKDPNQAYLEAARDYVRGSGTGSGSTHSSFIAPPSIQDVDPNTGAITWSSGAVTTPVITPQIESWNLPPGAVATPGAEPSYAARSLGVLQDYGAGLFGTLYDTAKTAATGWKHIVTQPVETAKALAWGATSLAGMSINGYKQIWANPADAFGALKWGSGEALGWLNDQFSGPEAGKFVGQAVAGLLPLGSIKGAGRAGWSSEIESSLGANRGASPYRLVEGADEGFSYTPRAGSRQAVLPEALDLQAKLPRVRFSTETMEAMGDAPAGMKNAHRHHVLEVNGRAGDHRTLVREGQDILRSYKIDPLQGPENLVWAPNKGHTATAAKNLVDELRTLKQVGAGRDLIVDTLRRHGQQAAKR